MKNKLYRIISILLTVSILLSIASITPTYASIYREEDLEIIWLNNYISLSSFSEGLAAVMRGGKYGYINKEGKVVVPFVYDWVHDFSEGLAAVKKGYKWGYINQEGEVVVPFVYDDLSGDFSEGLAKVGVLLPGRGPHYDYEIMCGYINQEGKDQHGKENRENKSM